MMNNPLMRQTESRYFDIDAYVDELNNSKLAKMSDWFWYVTTDDYGVRTMHKMEFQGTGGWFRENPKEGRNSLRRYFQGDTSLAETAYQRACRQRTLKSTV